MKLMPFFVAALYFAACTQAPPLSTTANSNQSPSPPNTSVVKPAELVSYKLIKEEVKNDGILSRSIIDTRVFVSGKLTRECLEQTLRNIMQESRSRNSSKIKHPKEVSNFIYAHKTKSYLPKPCRVGREACIC
jgi:hypothetical protein